MADEDGAEPTDGSEDEAENEETEAAVDDSTEAAFEAGDGPLPVGVKLGSTRTVIYVPEEDGSLRTVRTLTCLSTYDDPLTGEERVIYGEQAAREYPDRVRYMLRSGLPEDDENADLAKQFFSELVDSQGIPEESAVVYAIPTIENEAGLANLSAVIEESGIGRALVRSFPESLCGSIPALGDDLEAIDEIFLAINMGSTNLEACAYRHGEQLSPFSTGSVTGNEVDRRIANAVEEETQGRVNIDRTTAREYKEEHGDFAAFEPFTDVIQQPGGGSHEFTIERSVMDPLDDYVDEVVDEVANEFLSELANSHMKPYQIALSRPIAVTGGMACIPGIVSEFETRLGEELNREVEATAPERPDLAAAQGAQRIATRLAERL
jgi:actin-like ATPase involved in cell morphogenesis